MPTKPFSKRVEQSRSQCKSSNGNLERSAEERRQHNQPKLCKTNQQHIAIHNEFAFIFYSLSLHWNGNSKTFGFPNDNSQKKEQRQLTTGHTVFLSQRISHSGASYNKFRAFALWNSICTPLIFIANCGILYYWKIAMQSFCSEWRPKIVGAAR